MKQLLLATLTVTLLSSASFSFAKTPALTTPTITPQEYAGVLGFELLLENELEDGEIDANTETTEKGSISNPQNLPEPIDQESTQSSNEDNKADQKVDSKKQSEKDSEKNHNTDTSSNEKLDEAVKPLPQIKEKDLIHECDISLAQPFAVEHPQNIELALGGLKDDKQMIIKLRKTPMLMTKTHFEPEHLHIWSNEEHNAIMTLEVEEVYKDKFVALQSGTLTLLTPKIKEDYKAVLTCKP